MRSLSPLPSTRTTPSSRSRSPRSRPDRLADADAGGVERLEQRPVALMQRRVAGHRAQEELDLGFVERLRVSPAGRAVRRPPRSDRSGAVPLPRRSRGTTGPRPAPARSTTTRAPDARRRRGARRGGDVVLHRRFADPRRVVFAAVDAGTPRSGAGRGGRRPASSTRARARPPTSLRARRAVASTSVGPCVSRRRQRRAAPPLRRLDRQPGQATLGPLARRFTNAANSGCGRFGRLLNSGCAWVATKNGCVSGGSSMNSTSKPSGELPEQHHAVVFEHLAVPVVELVAVTVPFVDDLFAVGVAHDVNRPRAWPGRRRVASCRPCRRRPSARP